MPRTKSYIKSDLTAVCFSKGEMYLIIPDDKSIESGCSRSMEIDTNTGFFFYLETSKYLKKYASYEKNVHNKNFLFSKGKSDFAKMYPKPHPLGAGGGGGGLFHFK